ncbi:cytochrome c peroxidase [Modicisalibacter ilicicola DSM 19980]|uniref:Cytochrome c peroxidase n=1 Tax=Modicisalibacter ilicicola DSM 19980 TaxID=1121942 RepID=A0A1M4SGK3_9GAMM|nr:cytochrome-c peroxidase [Halomonas ilicicola]SHE31363.1 cytochrome c peroxidase [Halomonas ilicicola DSM 19980]
MQKHNLVLMVAGMALAGAAMAAEDKLMSQAQGLFKPIPQEPPELEGNPSSPAKVELGKMLYFEPRLSKSHTISCNSCHQVGLGGTDMLETSVGHGWQMGRRNSPTVLNAVFNTAQFWDGRAEDLAEQAGGPLVNPVEMAITHEHAVEMIKGIPGYQAVFEEAFPKAEDPITIGNIQDVIALFEATLITPNAPFDQYLQGDADALTEQQKTGLELFVNKGCAACHSGVNLGGDQYQPFGVVEQPGADFLPREDKGRFEVTQSASDEYVYKVPSLRNIALTPPYFHSGKAWDLKQAVAVMGSAQLGAELNDEEVNSITAFLHSLTGEQPKVAYPILPPSTAETPQPQLGIDQ